VGTGTSLRARGDALRLIPFVSHGDVVRDSITLETASGEMCSSPVATNAVTLRFAFGWSKSRKWPTTKIVIAQDDLTTAALGARLIHYPPPGAARVAFPSFQRNSMKSRFRIWKVMLAG
jgi:hypothetical protein